MQVRTSTWVAEYASAYFNMGLGKKTKYGLLFLVFSDYSIS